MKYEKSVAFIGLQQAHNPFLRQKRQNSVVCSLHLLGQRTGGRAMISSGLTHLKLSQMQVKRTPDIIYLQLRVNLPRYH